MSLQHGVRFAARGVQIVQTELSEPISIRLPVSILERIKQEAEADMIPFTFVMRRCLIRAYSGDSFVSANSTKSTGVGQNIQEPADNGNTND